MSAIKLYIYARCRFTIEEIKEIEIVGKKRQYYVLKFAIGNMVTNVPIENSEEIGIRPVIEKQEAKRHFNIFVTRSLKMTRIGINVRENNLIKIKSGRYLSSDFGIERTDVP